MREPCTECGYYVIHSRYCPQFAEPGKPESTDAPSEDQEWTPPENAQEALQHYEVWVEAWAGECFDCPAEIPWRGSLFSVEHQAGCMVKWLHEKLAKEARAA